MRYLRQNTAATVFIGPLIDWQDARTPLTDNDLFEAAALQCRLIDGQGTGHTLSLAKTGGDNNINLDGFGSASLTLTAGDAAEAGELRITLLNAVSEGISSDLILPAAAEFCVLPQAVYDAMVAGTDPLKVVLTGDYDAIKTAAQAGDAMSLTQAAAAITGNPVIHIGRYRR